MHSGIDTATLIKKLFFYNKNRYFLYETEKKRNMKKYGKKNMRSQKFNIFELLSPNLQKKRKKVCFNTKNANIWRYEKYTTGEITRYKSVFLHDIKRY